MKNQILLIITAGLITILSFITFNVTAQNASDTLTNQVTILGDRVLGTEERLTTTENDLSKLTKIKFSGYIQAQWLNYEAASAYPDNVFQVRRARFKLTYEPVSGLVFVLQPDFAPGNMTIKDAYAVANDKWLHTFSLWAGKFNRPNYEVEYSSGNREVPERSRMIRTLYPDERAIGAKLEINPPDLPLKVQIAVLNGNDGISINNPVYNYGTGKWDNANTVGQNNDFDNFKDVMVRATYGLKFGQYVSLNVGAHGYYGQIKANSKDLLKSDYTYDKALENIGNGAPKQWLGVEAQLYADILGGLALKGEYISGLNSMPGINASSSAVTNASVLSNDTLTLTTLTTKNVYNAPAISRNFSGFYIYLVKNIGKKNQLAVRYDYFNPNTKLSSDEIGTAKYDAKVADVVKNDITFAGTDPVVATNNQTKTVTTNKLTSGLADIPYGTWTFGYSYFFNDYIKLMVAYEIPLNSKVGVVDPQTDKGNVTSNYTVNGVTSAYDYSNVIKQNTLTVRVQAKF